MSTTPSPNLNTSMQLISSLYRKVSKVTATNQLEVSRAEL
jgi:hypothetical protein